MDFALFASLLERFGFPAATSIAALWWIAKKDKHNREDQINTNTVHANHVMTLTQQYRDDIKQLYKDFRGELERLMAEHAREREDARKSWQHSIEELKQEVKQINNR